MNGMRNLHNRKIFECQVPIIDPVSYQGSYHTIPVDCRHRLYHEPLVRLESLSIAYECYHAKTDGLNPPYCCPVAGSRQDMWLRKSAAEKLSEANELLYPFGVELFVLDGYRSIDCQRGLWQFFLQDAKQQLPQGTMEDWRDYALQHLVDPAAFSAEYATTWPSHTTGGAVDITLRDLSTHTQLDMGVQFEVITVMSHNDYFERRLISGSIELDDPRLYNRRLLYWAMDQAGFVNDPFVFWHYDWGNQLYRKNRQALFGDIPRAAWYGFISAPDD